MQNEKNTVEKLKEKNYGFLWLSFKYAKGMTNENEIIKGGSFYSFGKQLFTIAYADTDWVDEEGKPYKFKLDRGILYIKKIAVGFL